MNSLYQKLNLNRINNFSRSTYSFFMNFKIQYLPLVIVFCKYIILLLNYNFECKLNTNKTNLSSCLFYHDCKIKECIKFKNVSKTLWKTENIFKTWKSYILRALVQVYSKKSIQ